MIGPSLICLGVSWMRRGPGWACALDGYPPPTALGRLAHAAPAALVLTAAVTGPGRDGRVNQEREPSAVDRGGDLGVGGECRLPGERAAGPASDLVRGVGGAQAQLVGEGGERLLWYRLPCGAGVLDAAPGGQGVRGLVQHDLHDRAAPGRQQLPGDEQLGGPLPAGPSRTHRSGQWWPRSR